VIALRVNRSEKAKNQSIYCITSVCMCAKAESCLRSICVYIIYEFNMWIKRCYCSVCDYAACKSVWKCEKSIDLLHHVLTKLMMIAFMLLITDTSWAAILINWSAFSFSIMLLRLDIYCMRIWHWFWRKLIKFCRMSLNNLALTLLFAFSLCKVI